MTIRFVCPECKRTLRAQPTHAGRQFRCPNPECRAAITVPHADAAGEGSMAGSVFVSTAAGTPGYAAPEQVSAGKPVDGRAGRRPGTL